MNALSHYLHTHALAYQLYDRLLVAGYWHQHISAASEGGDDHYPVLFLAEYLLDCFITLSPSLPPLGSYGEP